MPVTQVLLQRLIPLHTRSLEVAAGCPVVEEFSGGRTTSRVPVRVVEGVAMDTSASSCEHPIMAVPVHAGLLSESWNTFSGWLVSIVQ